MGPDQVAVDSRLIVMQLFLIEDGQPINTNVDYRGIIVLEEHIDQVLALLNDPTRTDQLGHILTSALWVDVCIDRAGKACQGRGGGGRANVA